MKFKATISKSDENNKLWTSIIVIPNDIYLKMREISSSKRIVCAVNDALSLKQF
jgi:hypothetical protein